MLTIWVPGQNGRELDVANLCGSLDGKLVSRMYPKSSRIYAYDCSGLADCA